MSKNINFLKKNSVKQIIIGVITLAVAVGLFLFTRNVVACWTVTPLPGFPPAYCAPTDKKGTFSVNPEGTPDASGLPNMPDIVTQLDVLPPPWDGASRVNVLLIGVDHRDWEAGGDAPRSDTMILLTIDPITKTAGMLSIPRDLWVNIPGSGYGKINTAYSIGEGAKLPGGGPGLAMRTVEQFLGVPIQYFAQVDFSAFVRFIDEIGGVKLDITERIEVDPIGPDNDTIIEPGRYTLPGDLALAYARARNTEGGDVDRASRQQQVVFAMRDRLIEYGPSIIAKAPALYQELSSGIRTNLPFEDALRLAVLAREVKREDIKSGIINFEMVILGQSPDGLSIFKPIPDQVRVLRDEIFTSTGALRPMAQGDIVSLLQEEGAQVGLYNGTYTADIATRTTSYLQSQGINVIGIGNADRLYSNTTIVVRDGRVYALRRLMEIFNIRSSALVVMQFDPNAQTDIDVFIGDDWVFSNPMP